MITLVPFETSHIRLIDRDPVTEPGALSLLPPDHWDNLKQCATVFSAFAGGEFLGFAGYYLLPWKTSAQVFLWAMPGVHNYPQQVHKLARRAIAGMQNRGIDRISCEVRCGNDRAERWVKLLGFKLEAPRMRKYGPDGSDFSLYAIVKD